MLSNPIRRRMREVHATWSPQERMARAEEGRRRIRALLKLIAPATAIPTAHQGRAPYLTAR